ncbi:hypothetical protein AL013_05245 [Mariprofundus ferrooxydans]|uniref:Shedu protein SduA C-terminal domain-containing protein n=1 Tax=Mariprofundus ferrooxydans PV-1 TaxID=314345 RepID=Q0F221_9PROT|nr:Shedu anti-phage system protein SduA domain-containing protein [Mariprofundus ferrooxydans]EAU55729.1 hypothetical protein SPV1_02237 [Mariprofundus ferrooxydans PV-1]KON47888.1 hypothetical protein AL013_05245 [Mariprofundus ferrooxydans]
MNSKTARIDKWTKRDFIEIPFTSSNPDFTKDDENVSNYLTRVKKRYKGKEDTEEIYNLFSQSGIIKAARELIYNVKNGAPVFHVIGYSFNVSRATLELGHLIDIIIESTDEKEISEEIKNTLAIASIEEVPVYPNIEELAEELSRHYRDMMIEGFEAPDGKGGKMRLKLTKSPGRKIETIHYLNDILLNEPRHPSELTLIRAAVQKELGKLNKANQLISILELAINELDELLKAKKRNENKLQSCLTNNPILFGLEYQKIIPKYRLGSEYETDYALERYSGIIDVLEIESSNLQVFNKNGDPSQYLTHAEQQVMDWLQWIERNHPYARESLPGITRPVGFVVIGRSNKLDKKLKQKLLHRNTMFRGNLEILTFDDVLQKAKTMLNILSGTKSLKKA